GWVVLDVDRRRRALEDVELLGPFADVRNDLNRSGARADDADALARKACQAAFGAAARVTIVPAARMEGMALEVFEPGDARKLRPVEGAGREHDETGAHAVAVVGRDDPARSCRIPLDQLDTGLQAGIAVEVELAADRVGVLEDFLAVGVLLPGNVVHLLEQRQV